MRIIINLVFIQCNNLAISRTIDSHELQTTAFPRFITETDMSRGISPPLPVGTHVPLYIRRLTINFPLNKASVSNPESVV
jgi:hypothetical protein